MDTECNDAPERSSDDKSDRTGEASDDPRDEAPSDPGDRAAPENRTDPPLIANEYDTVVGYIDYHRQTLTWKVRGLDIDQLRQPLQPSDMTLGGMLAHLSFVEDFWISLVVGRDMPEPWASTDWDADPDRDWHLAATSGAEELWGLWEASVARSRRILDDLVENHGAEAVMTTTHKDWGTGEQVSLRWILVHLVEEYARHVGHADLIRESIDGQKGE